jgi:hypothetical protein
VDRISKMSYREKFHKAFQAACSYHDRIPDFIAQRLDGQAVVELTSVWQAGIMPIPEHVPDEEKYAAAYNNWQWMARCNLEFIEEQLGSQGLDDYVRGEIQHMRRALSELDLAGARFLDVIAPRLGFRAKAEQLLYEMQWMTPLALTVISGQGLQARTSPCKMLETPGMQHQGCELNCRRILSGVAAGEFHIKLVFQCQGDGCRISLTPLSS